MDITVYLFIGLAILFIAIIIVVTKVVNKIINSAENKYARHKNKKNPTNEAKLIDLHKLPTKKD